MFNTSAQHICAHSKFCPTVPSKKSQDHYKPQHFCTSDFPGFRLMAWITSFTSLDSVISPLSHFAAFFVPVASFLRLSLPLLFFLFPHLLLAVAMITPFVSDFRNSLTAYFPPTFFQRWTDFSPQIFTPTFYAQSVCTQSREILPAISIQYTLEHHRFQPSQNLSPSNCAHNQAATRCMLHQFS